MGKQSASWPRFFFAVSAVFCLRPNALILHSTSSFLRLTFTTPTVHTVVLSREGIQNPFSTQKAGVYQLSNLVTFALSVWQGFSSTRFSFRPIFFPQLIFNTYLYRICKEFQCSYVWSAFGLLCSSEILRHALLCMGVGLMFTRIVFTKLCCAQINDFVPDSQSLNQHRPIVAFCQIVLMPPRVRYSASYEGIRGSPPAPTNLYKPGWSPSAR